MIVTDYLESEERLKSLRERTAADASLMPALAEAESQHQLIWQSYLAEMQRQYMARVLAGIAGGA